VSSTSSLLQQSAPHPDDRCDVLIIGAGPAGAAAARVLAREGVDVVLADQRTFPRDKVCGDGLISDALHALSLLGVDASVQREAWRGSELRVYAPDGTHVSLQGEFACLPRERLDEILLEAALAAGARFVHGAGTSPVIDGGRVAGATVKAADVERPIRARVTILAAGANLTTLAAFGVPGPRKPEAVAGRAYFEAPSELAHEIEHLVIAYQREWCPGYGWIFPAPGRRFNIGVGLFGPMPARGRLHQFFDAFCRTFPPAARLLAAATCVRPFRGAPIRSGLGQPSFGRPGLLAVGESVAATYSATGEGIGKAMESGILAAQMVTAALRTGRPLDGLEDAYRAEFERRFIGRYRAYRLAQRWAASPALLNVLARRANAGKHVQEELEALVAERGDAAKLFSATGLLKALFR
jgi:geranylgeranyl reductase family protein